MLATPTTHYLAEAPRVDVTLSERNRHLSLATRSLTEGDRPQALAHLAVGLGPTPETALTPLLSNQAGRPIVSTCLGTASPITPPQYAGLLREGLLGTTDSPDQRLVRNRILQVMEHDTKALFLGTWARRDPSTVSQALTMPDAVARIPLPLGAPLQRTATAYEWHYAVRSHLLGNDPGGGSGPGADMWRARGMQALERLDSPRLRCAPGSDPYARFEDRAHEGILAWSTGHRSAKSLDPMMAFIHTYTELARSASSLDSSAVATMAMVCNTLKAHPVTDPRAREEVRGVLTGAVYGHLADLHGDPPRISADRGRGARMLAGTLVHYMVGTPKQQEFQTMVAQETQGIRDGGSMRTTLVAEGLRMEPPQGDIIAAAPGVQDRRRQWNAGWDAVPGKAGAEMRAVRQLCSEFPFPDTDPYEWHPEVVRAHTSIDSLSPPPGTQRPPVGRFR